MTTAVQPSELVFEFASNGMDEINQVQSHQRNHFFKCNSLLLLIFFFHDSTYRVCISVQTRRAQWPTVCLFLHDTLYAILLKNEIHFKTNKTSVNSMATGVGLACDL